VVIWDLHESDERDRGAIFAALKAKLVAHVLEHPGRAAFIVDEAVTVTETSSAHARSATWCAAAGTSVSRCTCSPSA
jgi:hypothetical protein